MDDERTPVLQLPLPHPDHLLADDVLRLRAALLLVDTGFGQERSAVQAALTTQLGAVQAALSSQQGQVQTALTATTTAVADTLDEVSTDVLRRVRRLQLNQLLNLDL